MKITISSFYKKLKSDKKLYDTEIFCISIYDSEFTYDKCWPGINISQICDRFDFTNYAPIIILMVILVLFTSPNSMEMGEPRNYSTYTKFGNTASFSALLTRRLTAKVSPFFRDNSRLSYRKANLKKSSWWGKKFLSPLFFVDFSELKFIPQKTRYKVWKHRRARQMFPS